MKLVLDASVGLKGMLPEDDSDKAIALGLDDQSGVHELVAPDTAGMRANQCGFTATPGIAAAIEPTGQPLAR